MERADTVRTITESEYDTLSKVFWEKVEVRGAGEMFAIMQQYEPVLGHNAVKAALRD